MWKWLKYFLNYNKSGKFRAPEKTVSSLPTSQNKAARLQIARDLSTHAETLCHLAEKDPDSDIRMAVAKNPSTPHQATDILAQDSNPDVRMVLAERLLRLLPDLEEDRQSRLYAYTIQTLGNLALDEVLKIRIALSSALKDYGYAPPKLVGKLAKDIEKKVSEPILLFCSAVGDEDLLDILKGHPESWAIQAIARRHSISEPVSEAVIDTGDKQAGIYLIANKGALLNHNTLEKIVTAAAHTTEWQKPLAVRASLPENLATRLAKFADESIRQVLIERDDFSEETRSEIVQAFKRRLNYANEQAIIQSTKTNRVRHFMRKGLLNEQTISDALAMRDYNLVKNAIATLAHLHPNDVQHIIDLKAPKPVIALAWKAGLSVRMALLMQTDLAKLSHKDIIYPKGGTQYPLTEKEMQWHLDFLNVKSRP